MRRRGRRAYRLQFSLYRWRSAMAWAYLGDWAMPHGQKKINYGHGRRTRRHGMPPLCEILCGGTWNCSFCEIRNTYAMMSSIVPVCITYRFMRRFCPRDLSSVSNYIIICWWSAIELSTGRFFRTRPDPAKRWPDPTRSAGSSDDPTRGQLWSTIRAITIDMSPFRTAYQCL